LTRPFDRHLDSDEIDGLVSSHAASVTDSGRLSEQALGEAKRHVESCNDCSRKVQMHKSVQSEILRMGGPSNMPPGSNCVADTEWFNVAAGLLPESETRELMKHAAQCGHCGPLLRTAVDTLSDDATHAEKTSVASLTSARPEWQKAMAATLRSTAEARPTTERRSSWLASLLSWPRTAFGLAFVTALVIAAWFGLRTMRPPSTEQLLAQAYSDRRTLEMRFPGAKYAPLRVERSTGDSNLDKPASLLKAEALISENLQKNPRDPVWLQARARADMLDGNYESAIKALQQALESQPNSPSLLTDMASAYFERAESADRPIDYGNAIEALGKALTKSPDDPVALFNRALACERMFLYTQAIDDWEHYLRVDSQGAWADDARKRLLALRQKIKLRDQSQKPLLEPAQFADAIERGSEVSAAIDIRVEEYLYRALTGWLRVAYPVSSLDAPSQEQSDARRALESLARLMIDKHHDSWMEDLLTSLSATSGPAVKALSEAAVANQAVNPVEALRRATEAEVLFRDSENIAGTMRAEFEETYALHWLEKSAQCAAKAESLIAHLQDQKYLWILTQVHLESFVCLNAMERPHKAEAALKIALATARDAGYETLYLRGVGFSAFLETENGNRRMSWSLNRLGLERYWKGLHPPVRANQFYSDLCSDAEEKANWQLALLLAREALKFAIDDGDTSFEAISRYRLANDALMAESIDEGLSEYKKAHRLFENLPQDPATRAYRAYSELFSAKRELQNEDLSHLRDRMTTLTKTIPELSNDLIAMDFYHTWGELERKQGNSQEAEWALTRAVSIAEKRLQSLSTERQRLTWNREVGSIYRALVETMFIADSDGRRALQLWEWYRGAALRKTSDRRVPEFATKDTMASAGARQPLKDVLPMTQVVDRSLAPATAETVLVYAVLPNGLAIWALDDRGIDAKWISVSETSLDALAERFRALCGDPHSDDVALQEIARHFYQLLIKPVEGHLTADRTVVVESDGVLAEVPFRMLVNESQAYFGDLYRLTYSPGLMYRQSSPSTYPILSRDRVLVVSSPTSHGEQIENSLPLPGADAEAGSVAARFERPIVLTGRQATVETVQQYLSQTNIFHFAGHAVASVDGLHLRLASSSSEQGEGTSELLTADRITGMGLRQCKLVVLSACETAQSGETGLADPENLVRGFLRAGVGNVVASRWKVDSEATAAFMNYFYEAVLAGEAIPDLTGEICTKWNERESTWRKHGSCPSRGTSQSKS